jgi:ADP-ribosylglycohydrolase
MATNDILKTGRYAGLLKGSFVGDSLSLGAHWIYDQAEIRNQFGRITSLSAPATDYHRGKGAGDFTHHGDQTLILLESLGACSGHFDPVDFANRWQAFWGYSLSYQDKATKATLDNLEKGSDLLHGGSTSSELAGACRIAPLLVALQNEDESEVIQAARQQTVITHNNPIVADAAEFIVRATRRLIDGAAPEEALATAAEAQYEALPIREYLAKAKRAQRPVEKAVEQIGQACPIEQAFPAFLAVFLLDTESFESAMINNVMAGGDSAARALPLGILLGAYHGVKAIPNSWLTEMKANPVLDAFLEQHN